MPRWKKKTEEEVESKEEETPLELEKEVVNEESNEVIKEESNETLYEEKTREVMYSMNRGLEWASDLSGAIRRALEDRTRLVVTERDLNALEFYTVVLSYTNPEELAKTILKLEQEERAKMDNDMSVS